MNVSVVSFEIMSAVRGDDLSATGAVYCACRVGMWASMPGTGEDSYSLVDCAFEVCPR